MIKYWCHSLGAEPKPIPPKQAKRNSTSKQKVSCDKLASAINRLSWTIAICTAILVIKEFF